MTYSAALFTDGHSTSAEAQVHKIERLLDATGVQRGTRLLEIGTGWGELALRAARRGAHVTTLTLSNEQALWRVSGWRTRDWTAEWIFGCRITEMHRDLRRHRQRRNDRGGGGTLVAHLFPDLDRCLAPGGRVGLQAITMAHDRLLATRRRGRGSTSTSSLAGAFLPSTPCGTPWRTARRLASSIDLSFGQSYARTLACWQGRFAEGEDEVARWFRRDLPENVVVLPRLQRSRLSQRLSGRRPACADPVGAPLDRTLLPAFKRTHGIWWSEVSAGDGDGSG